MRKLTHRKKNIRTRLPGRLLILILVIPLRMPAQDPKLMLPIGHKGHADLTFSPDSKKVLSLGEDGTAKIWDLNTGLMLGDLIGHRGKILSAAYISNGENILTTSEDQSIKIWNSISGSLLHTLAGNRGELVAFKLYLNDKLALVLNNQGGIYTSSLWDMGTGKLLNEIYEYKFRERDGKIYGLPPIVVLSPDGRNMVRTDSYNFSPDSLMLVVANARTGRRLDTLEGYFPDLDKIQYSPDGKMIVAVSETRFPDGYLYDPDTSQTARASLIAWNAVSGKIINRYNLYRFRSFSFDPKSAGVLNVDVGDSVEKINIITGKKLPSTERPAGSDNWIIAGKNRKIAMKMDVNRLIVAEEAMGRNIGNFNHTSRIKSARYNEKNQVIFTATVNNQLHAWDIATKKLLYSFDGGEDKILSYVDSPEDRLVAIITDMPESDDEEAETTEGLRLWEYHTGRVRWTFDSKGTDLKAKFSPDGKNIAVDFESVSDSETDEEINNARILDITTGRKKSNFTGHASYVRSGIFSPDQKKIITTYSDSSIRIWDIEKGRFTGTLSGHSGLVNGVQFNADGNYLVSASNDSTAKLWDVVSGKLIHTFGGHESEVYSASFSPDTKYVVTVSDVDTRVWDAGSGKLVRVLKGNNGYEAQFSPDGKFIVSGPTLWNAQTGETVFELDWHTMGINSSRFSSDGKYIITASGDETAKLWSVEYGELLYSFDDHSDEVVFATFSEDNRKIITSSLDNTVKIWDVQSGSLQKSIYLGPNTVARDIHLKSNKLLCVYSASEIRIVDLSGGETLYGFFATEDNGYLVVDRFNRFDGSENARKLLYFTCNDEVIELDQVKDQLWTPGLAERIVKGDSINALKLADLSICGLTPQVKEMGAGADSYHFRITPRRGGLGETALYLNGIEIRRYNRVQLKNMGGSYDLVVSKKELSPYLIPGQENVVNVKAWVQDNTISSRGLIKKLAQTTDSASVPTLYAVFVGISDYKGEYLDLSYAAKDAEDIATAVSASARKLLNTDGKERVFVYQLTTREGRYRLPEKAAIRKTLEEIGTRATANDILLLFFAGHGVMRGGSNQQFYFLTADASPAAVSETVGDMGISTAELTEWVKPANIKAQKRVMIFDACNSGQAIQDFVQLGKTGQGYRTARSDEKGMQIKAIERLNSQSGMIILSASASDQLAYEMSLYSQGLLTYSLLKVMKQQPEILENGRYLDVTNWLNATKKMVIQLAELNRARQDPQLSTNNNFNIGVVDDEVRNTIKLESEKPIFTRSSFQNAEMGIDNLRLRQATDREFLLLSNSAGSEITFSPDYEGNDGFSLGGNYTIEGKEVRISLLLVKGGSEIRQRFEVRGDVSDLAGLGREMIRIAVAAMK